MVNLISIHAPRVGCDGENARFYAEGGGISIHAPRVGCDAGYDYEGVQMAVFQSTHPVWGATFTYVAHATVEGHFNPRTPCGVRPDVAKALGSNGDFNPRTPCGVRPLAL